MRSLRFSVLLRHSLCVICCRYTTDAAKLITLQAYYTVSVGKCLCLQAPFLQHKITFIYLYVIHTFRHTDHAHIGRHLYMNASIYMPTCMHKYIHITYMRKDFSSSRCVQTGSGAHLLACTMGTGGVLSPGLKSGRGRDADHSPPSITEVENE
jgi:hypothetical protein